MTDTPTPNRPQALAARADCGGRDCAENQPLPERMAERMADPAAGKSQAEWAYQRIALYIRKFEESLDGDHEVGMGFAGSDAGVLHIRGMGYFAPDILTFYGRDGSGVNTQLIQHVSQLNVMLKAAPKQTATANRIGFMLERSLDGEDIPQGAEGADRTG